MNGRVYDLGRFMSVDPFIQSVGNSQSVNPYSYVMNNPLAGIDPTGYFSCNPDGTCGRETPWNDLYFPPPPLCTDTGVCHYKGNGDSTGSNGRIRGASSNLGDETTEIGSPEHNTENDDSNDGDDSNSDDDNIIMSEISELYGLPESTQEQANLLAEIMGLPSELLEDASQEDVEAMAAAILYRHLDRNDRMDAMEVIRSVDSEELQGKLIEKLLDATFVNPQWGIWSLTNQELKSDQKVHQTIADIAAFVGLSASALGFKDIIREAWEDKKLGKGGIAMLAIYGVMAFNNMELNKTNTELERRSTLKSTTFFKEE